MVRKGKGSGSIGIKADSRFMVRTTRFLMVMLLLHLWLFGC